MKASTLIALPATLMVVSCATPARPRDFSASVASIRAYSDSLLGLTREEARARLAGARLSDHEWRSGGFGGPELVARFPDYEVSLLFHEGRSITTSFHILTR